MSIDPKLLEFCRTENQRSIVQAVIDHGTQRAAATALNLAHGTVGNCIVSVKRNAERRGYAPEYDLTHVIPETMTLKGTSTLYHAEKGRMMQWVKTNADKEAQARIIIEGIKDALEEYRGTSEPIQHMGLSQEDCLHTMVMGDAHFGAMAHKEETRIDDFDSEIAYRIMQGAVDYLTQAAPPTKEALFVNVGDALHTDNSSNKTRGHGHQLDVDSRYYRIIKVFVWSMIHAIQRMLEKHEKVTVINAAGTMTLTPRTGSNCHWRCTLTTSHGWKSSKTRRTTRCIDSTMYCLVLPMVTAQGWKSYPISWLTCGHLTGGRPDTGTGSLDTSITGWSKSSPGARSSHSTLLHHRTHGMPSQATLRPVRCTR